MGRFFRVVLTTRGLDRLQANLEKRAAAVVLDAALNIQKDAMAQAHVLSGAMRSSIYVIARGPAGISENDYADAVTTATALNERADFAPARTPTRRISAIVATPINYGFYEEIRRGHKFLLPAAEMTRPVFKADMARIFDDV